MKTLKFIIFYFALAALTTAQSLDSMIMNLIDFRKADSIPFIDQSERVINKMWLDLGGSLTKFRPKNVDIPLYRLRGHFTQGKIMEEILVFKDMDRSLGKNEISPSQFYKTSGWFIRNGKNFTVINNLGDSVANIGDVNGDGKDDIFSAKGNLAGGETWYNAKIITIKPDKNPYGYAEKVLFNLGNVYEDTCLNYRSGFTRQEIKSSVVKIAVKTITIEQYAGFCFGQQAILAKIKFVFQGKKIITLK